jgi:ABC-2 type transport system permease protein
MPEPTNVAGIGPLAGWALSRQRRSLIAWAIAVAGVSLLYLSFWPSMEGMDIDAMTENLPDGMVDAMGYDRIDTPAGYLNTTVYGLLGPALLMVFATIKGSTLVAGDEEAGTLELELTAPVPRRHLYLGRLAALWALLGALTTIIAALTVALLEPLDMDVAVLDVLATSFGLLLLAGAVGTIALAAGAVTGRRAIGAGAGALVAVGAFMLDAIGPSANADWMTTISPFSWYLANEPLANGPDLAGLGRLAALTLVAAAVGAHTYDRRDLMV